MTTSIIPASPSWAILDSNKEKIADVIAWAVSVYHDGRSFVPTERHPIAFPTVGEHAIWLRAPDGQLYPLS